MKLDSGFYKFQFGLNASSLNDLAVRWHFDYFNKSHNVNAQIKNKKLQVYISILSCDILIVILSLKSNLWWELMEGFESFLLRAMHILV